MTAFDFFAVIYYFFLALSGRSIHVWGLHPAGVNTRIVVGGSVFLPLLLQYPEIPNIQSLAAKQYFQVVYLDQVVE